MIFEKLKRIQALISNEEKPKSAHSKQFQNIIAQLLDMGFTQEQAETAAREIEYPDVNLAAEWLFNHPDLPKKPQTIEEKEAKPSLTLSMNEMSKDTFQAHSLGLLNSIGRMMIFQLFQLPLEKCADFVLSLLSF